MNLLCGFPVIKTQAVGCLAAKANTRQKLTTPANSGMVSGFEPKGRKRLPKFRKSYSV
jgi:hypothetical protein